MWPMIELKETVDAASCLEESYSIQEDSVGGLFPLGKSQYSRFKRQVLSSTRG
jgi:hypothetical protein